MNRFRERIGVGPPVVIAHRGDSRHAPENTIEAAIKGHASGAFAWELDVHLSRDGVPVVLHDESLRRTTDVAKWFAGDIREAKGFRVAEFDWDEIRSLDAGSWFVERNGGHRSAFAFRTLDQLKAVDREHFGSGKVRVPSLREALTLSRELNWPVNVELKTFPESDPRTLIEVLRLIDATDSADLVLISSFDHRDVARSAMTRPDIPTAALTETPLWNAGRYVRQIIGADYLHLSAAAMDAESRFYQDHPSAEHLRPFDEGDFHIPRIVYTVNDANTDGLAAHLATIGIAGIFTDDPRCLIELWGD